MSKNDSRQAKQLAEQEATRRRRTRNILIGAVVAIVVVAGIIAWASNRTETDTTAAVPAGIDSDLGVPVGAAARPSSISTKTSNAPSAKRSRTISGRRCKRSSTMATPGSSTT